MVSACFLIHEFICVLMTVHNTWIYMCGDDYTLLICNTANLFIVVCAITGRDIGVEVYLIIERKDNVLIENLTKRSKLPRRTDIKTNATF